MKLYPYFRVRNSKIHGRGVFATKPIPKGVKIMEYTGPIISSEEADLLVQEDENGHYHTMLFQIDEERVINGLEGDDARYVNHSCDPNCETVQYGDRIFVESIQSIKTGEELVYDYHLQVSGKITKKVVERYPCFCGAENCRGTQIAPDLLEKKGDAKAKAQAKAQAMKFRAKSSQYLSDLLSDEFETKSSGINEVLASAMPKYKGKVKDKQKKKEKAGSKKKDKKEKKSKKDKKSEGKKEKSKKDKKKKKK